MWVRVECINGPFNLATTHPRSPLDGQYIVNVSTWEELAPNTQQLKQLKACVGLHVTFWKTTLLPRREDNLILV